MRWDTFWHVCKKNCAFRAKAKALIVDTVSSHKKVTSSPLSPLSAFALQAKLPQRSIVSLGSNNQKPGEIIVGFSLESSFCKTGKIFGCEPAAVVVDVNWVSSIALLESPDDWKRSRMTGVEPSATLWSGQGPSTFAQWLDLWFHLVCTRNEHTHTRLHRLQSHTHMLAVRRKKELIAYEHLAPFQTSGPLILRVSSASARLQCSHFSETCRGKDRKGEVSVLGLSEVALSWCCLKAVALNRQSYSWVAVKIVSLRGVCYTLDGASLWCDALWNWLQRQMYSK